MQLQREKTIGQSLGKIVTNFQDVSPAEVTPDVFNSQQWVETLCVEMLSSRNLYWEPESTAFTGNRLCGRTWSNTCLSSSFPEGMQVFSVNHRVCTDHLDTVHRSEESWYCILEVVGNLLQCGFPDVSQKPTSQAGLAALTLSASLCTE